MDRPSLDQRKKDHLKLAINSQTGVNSLNKSVFYEPLFGVHRPAEAEPFDFAGKKMKAPLWISSMTGGTGEARHINQNLARACGEFGLGMALGSCRPLLESDEFFNDFALRPLVGDEWPFYANLGVAQVEELISQGQSFRLKDLVERLQADGLIIHLNPLQELFQPEGDVYDRPAIDTIKDVLDQTDLPLIVKEVGQGMGPLSLSALMQLPLQAIEFGAYGGTNFSQLELSRGKSLEKQYLMPLSRVGHSAEEMLEFFDQLLAELGEKALCRDVIISGGVTDFVHGHSLIEKFQGETAVYGQAKAFLEKAQGDYEDLKVYVQAQVEGLKQASQFLTARTSRRPRE